VTKAKSKDRRNTAKAKRTHGFYPEVEILSLATEIAFVSRGGVLTSLEQTDEVLGLLGVLRQSIQQCEAAYRSFRAERIREEKSDLREAEREERQRAKDDEYIERQEADLRRREAK
jgi:hypothetical protein